MQIFKFQSKQIVLRIFPYNLFFKFAKKCGTSGGVLIYFDKIEVVNRLKKDMAWATIKNYTINYDRTWIFDKIQYIFLY